jgi:hydrogenase nickel incorporation protein HypB
MCATCGCGTSAFHDREDAHGREHVHADGTRHSHPHEHGSDHDHDHGHDHGHDHDDDHGHGHRHGHRSIEPLEARVLARNDALAARNRAWFAGREILALNLVSAPGAGKTALLERTIRDVGGELAIHVIEGDQATANDADRIRAAGAPVVQLNTGTGCHLEADMVARALDEICPPVGAVVVIENVGNLVCPALFDLGERAKVVILSVAEGDDKPLKYPHMFRAADAVILSKIDLLPHVDFDVTRAIAAARTVNPAIAVLEVSARTGDGLDRWYGWIRQNAARNAARSAARSAAMPQPRSATTQGDPP